LKNKKGLPVVGKPFINSFINQLKQRRAIHAGCMMMAVDVLCVIHIGGSKEKRTFNYSK
jgi:hypothetical protein